MLNRRFVIACTCATSATLTLLHCGMSYAEYREQWLSASDVQHLQHDRMQVLAKPAPGHVNRPVTRPSLTRGTDTTSMRRQSAAADNDPIAAFAETGSKNGVKRSLKTVGGRVPS